MLQALNNGQGIAKVRAQERVDNATPKTKATGEQIAASPVMSPHAVNDLRPYAAYALFVIGLA